MSREHTVTINGEELTVTLDLNDYPEIIVESAQNSLGIEVEVSPAMEVEILMAVAVDVAGNMVDAAMDALEDR